MLCSTIFFFVFCGVAITTAYPYTYSTFLMPELHFPGLENMCYMEFRKELCDLVGHKNMKRCLGSLHYEITDEGRFCRGFSCVQMFSYCNPRKMQEFQASVLIKHGGGARIKPTTLYYVSQMAKLELIKTF